MRLPISIIPPASCRRRSAHPLTKQSSARPYSSSSKNVLFFVYSPVTKCGRLRNGFGGAIVTGEPTGGADACAHREPRNRTHREPPHG